ncbi:MAG: hypothetical protein ACK4WH_04670 [Phycisphaerales bacterium]
MRMPTQLAFGLLLASCAVAFAQYGAYRQPVAIRYGQRQPVEDAGVEIEEDADDAMLQVRAALRGEGDLIRPKTPLGRYIFTLDLTRTPETVLKARAKIAAEEREARINPSTSADDNQPDPAGGRASEHADGATEGMGDDPAADRQPLTAPVGDPGTETASDREQPGAVRTVQKVLTKGERRAADRFRLYVVAGAWDEVKAFLTEHAGEDAAAVYQHILTRLAGDSAIVPDEILRIADASPAELTDQQLTVLGQLLRGSIARGADPGHVGRALRRGTSRLGGESAAGRQRAASLLMAAGLPVEAQPFLDPLETARREGNAKLLNLHAMYFQGLAARKSDPSEKADAARSCWDLCLEVLGIPKAPTVERTAAVERALTFIEQVPEDVGEAWLRSVFQGSPDLAWALVERATSRARTAKARMRSVDDRVKLLLRLKRIGSAIVEHAGERAMLYATALDMMALSILDELEFTKQMQQSMQYGGEDERAQVVPSERLSECLPSAAWLRLGDPGLAGRLELLTAGVMAGSGDVSGVVEMVRPLVEVDRDRAQKIADSVIEAWPNYARGGRAGYDEDQMYSRGRYAGGYGGYGGYGYDGSIPLTRARQKRFIEQLGGLLGEFRRAGLSMPKPAGLVEAFSASHSQAEVFLSDDIAAVFGSIEQLPAEVTVELCDTMRKRLGSLWRSTRVQQEAGTMRSDRQIAEEVTRGYGLADELAQAALRADPDSWRVTLLLADLRYDKAEFLYGQKVDLATYAGLREAAFAGYKHAADLYAQDLLSGKSQPAALVYSRWVSSSLGASDLGFLTRQDQPDEDQIDRVVAAIDGLPEPMRNRHIGLFAKDVNTALQTISPELKVRYLTHACRVIGDHPEGAQARKTLAYYQDLKTEVELVLAVDGSTTVGSKDPFGASLAIWSTRAVSRESGGFGKYIQNQQYHPVTGQPVDYRDELEKRVREALSDRFEVVSVTFHKPGTPPMGVSRPGGGWEQHPLAYLLLRAKDASVDRIPPIRMDLDFSDGRGAVMLPVASAVQLIDARSTADKRVPSTIEVEQVLDARSSGDGKLTLEVRAVASGLVPSMESFLDMTPLAAAGFPPPAIEDNGVTILDLDTSGDAVVPRCERSWTLRLTAPADRGPRTFNFPLFAGVGGVAAKMSCKQYADADIVDCSPSVPVAVESRGELPLILTAIGLVLLVMFSAAAWVVLRRRRSATAPVDRAYSVPDQVTPVGAVALLRRISAGVDPALQEDQRREIIGEIREIELKYFSPAGNGTESLRDDAALRAIVERWVSIASARTSG